MAHVYAVDVAWDETATPDLPTLIGPFPTEKDALEFIRTSVPNGEARVRWLSYPYMRSRQ